MNLAIGKGATADGVGAFARGDGACAIGYCSFAWGDEAKAIGEHASATGASEMKVPSSTDSLKHMLNALNKPKAGDKNG